jgi:RNA polymerase sigma factor (sigma-70 family)
MVLGVCRRLVRDPHEAEDAFQAVFLVLVRRAESIRPTEMVGSWLHGVAYRTAARLKENAERRPQQLAHEPAIEPSLRRDEGLRAILDRELSRLPDMYRLPILMCDLEGHTRKQAAGRLGWPEGTVAGRLARGRARLAKRLIRLGVAPAAAGSAFVGEAACAAVPSSLADAARETSLTGLAPERIAALATAVAGSLEPMKWKVAVAGVLSFCVLSIGAGIGADEAQACHLRRRSRECACVPCPPDPCPPTVAAAPAERVPAAAEKPKTASDFDQSNRLDAVLLQCAEAVGRLKSVHVRNLVRTDREPGGKATTWTGEVRSLVPGYFALRLVDDSASDGELMVVTGKSYFEYRSGFKKLLIYELPTVHENCADYYLGLLLSGANLIAWRWLPNQNTAPPLEPATLRDGFAMMKNRYDLTITKDVGPQNPFWIYVEATSKSRENREFARAQLVVNATTMIPRRLWFEHFNGSEVTWDFKSVDTDVQLTPADFKPPEPPAGWEIQRVPLDPKPADEQRDK